jgi:hypothetical protein
VPTDHLGVLWSAEDGGVQPALSTIKLALPDEDVAAARPFMSRGRAHEPPAPAGGPVAVPIAPAGPPAGPAVAPAVAPAARPVPMIVSPDPAVAAAAEALSAMAEFAAPRRAQPQPPEAPVPPVPVRQPLPPQGAPLQGGAPLIVQPVAPPGPDPAKPRRERRRAGDVLICTYRILLALCIPISRDKGTNGR